MKVLEWIFETILDLASPLFPYADRSDTLKFSYIAGAIAIIIVCIGVIFLIIYVPLRMIAS